MNTKGPAATQYQYANTPICDPSECDDLKLNAKHRLLDQFGRYEKKNRKMYLRNVPHPMTKMRYPMADNVTVNRATYT